MHSPLVSVVMGSKSDWDTMQKTTALLEQLQISYKAEVVSAHRTPARLYEFAEQAKSNGSHLIIAAAGGAAHLPGMIAAITPIPVVGVPIKSSTLNGVDSLLSIVQMPKGVPVATMSIGQSGAANAALFAAAVLSVNHPKIAAHYNNFRQSQTETVIADPVLGEYTADE